MELTDEQRKRAEANRLAALAKKRQRENPNSWQLFKCRKVSRSSSESEKAAENENKITEKACEGFRVNIEICSSDGFSMAIERVPGFFYYRETEFQQRVEPCLSSVVPLRYVEVGGRGKVPVYKLKDYDLVVRCLKKIPRIQLQEIPWRTLAVVQKLSYSSIGGKWIPCMPNHVSDDEVDALLGKLPRKLRDLLLPFQLDGVKFGLRRGGRCLIADEMGLGKTIQAIAIACCFMSEGPVLVVCPAILRYSWAEELERWLPFCLPADIHLVFGHQNNLGNLTRCPKVVVISYTMLHRLRKSMLEQQWAVMIVDESHNVRCTKKMIESQETKAVLDMATNVNRIILLSGTPSLSRPYDIFHQINILWPGLLGKDKYEFAKIYCSMKIIQGIQGNSYKDFSKGVRLQELNVLLKETVMIRRMKEQVMVQLPPKRRQIIRLKLKQSDINAAMEAVRGGTGLCMDNECNCRSMLHSSPCHNGPNGAPSDNCFESKDIRTQHSTSREMSYQEIGIAKLSGFCEWLSNHPVFMEAEDVQISDKGPCFQKMIIFGHHLKVLDGIQDVTCRRGVDFVRIDGSTLPRARQMAVEAFRSRAEVKIAIIGITAGGVGLDFSSAQNVVFVELPKSVSELLQAEDRAHRRGQSNAVNIYIFCAKGTSDEAQLQRLNKSLYRVSTMMNGRDDAIQEIKVDTVQSLDFLDDFGASNENAFTKENMKVNYLNQDSVSRFVKCSAEDESMPKAKGDATSFSKFEPTNSQLSPANEKMQTEEAPSEASIIGKSGVGQQIEADGFGSISPNSLRFEVSRHTGRVHLHICIPGEDSRPRLLSENFRPEDLESHSLCTSTMNKEAMPIQENPIYRDVLLAFLKEWNNLRPVERSKLLGKPLQLPLDLELYYLKEERNHGSGGLLKGKSRRRFTPLNELSCALPENAMWKKITLSSGHPNKEKEYMQAWTIADEPLCKLCQKLCTGHLSKEPEFFEDLFCNLCCYEEYRIRTSQQALREALFQIEQGVCTNCKLDCHKLVKCIKPLSVNTRRDYVQKAAPNVAKHKSLLDKLIHEPVEGNAWHADHIVPVYKGGGECTLENMRTLCVACHSEVTAAQRDERCMLRTKAKEQLRVLILELKDGANEEPLKLMERVLLEEQNCEDDELLVDVPGSSYSITTKHDTDVT
ncbi:DNA annealing helicase and endonuclease ZRANB3 isoform X1 [Amborella trichopoda]|uniref:DNA annealing helicase and endonuclease ZRANB3 n=1 Tax=Amborella trichopoda TaxID=13333 RepID=W1NX14_AMBTC|nr:DNA annealing helicase and endonuclease ZRANB3 isoform X1 [Amborella trichopoda]ERM99888.1 hypothetical protein AMTR_s00110p00037960 [Amborella trichopoda]|eukprot:XP_020519137.1 DNA annealing helicase and endonuclease ZRANB3 isoform X1 [Amborella trichopoda]